MKRIPVRVSLVHQMRPATEERYMFFSIGSDDPHYSKGKGWHKGSDHFFKKGFLQGKKILNSLVYIRILPRNEPSP
jgi:hypothetical protein